VKDYAPQQISAKLNISTSAVHLYLRTARKKLNCLTVEQVIVRAISLDLIDHGDFNSILTKGL
jgi:DNA-binding CsgD family transcriptional regulator